MRAGSQQRAGLALVMGEQSSEDQVLIQGLLLEICEILDSLLKVLAPQFHHLYLFLFLWLDRVLLRHMGWSTSVVARGLFSCTMWTLSCGMWDLVP